MFVHFDKIFVLYVLIMIVGGWFTYTRMQIYLDVLTTSPIALKKDTVVVDTQITTDPVVADLTADLFLSYLTGSIIGLIDGSQKELLYYRHLHDIFRVCFTRQSKAGLPASMMSLDNFEDEVHLSILKIQAPVVRQSLRERLDKISSLIKTSGYYQQNNQLDANDIRDALQLSLELIQRYELVPSTRE